MKKNLLKSLSFSVLVMLATPAVADWPIAVADEFTVHQDHTYTEFDLLKNDTGSNLKVVEVNEWSENGGRLYLRTYVRTSRDQYHAYGDVSYSPREDFVGEDAFWYVIEDDQGRKNAVRVIVNVKPSDLELPKPLQDFIDVPKDTSVRIDALANDLFSNKFVGTVKTFRGDIVDFNTTTEQGGTVEKIEVYPREYLSFGPVRYGGYTLGNTLKYQFKYTPPAGFTGTDSFTYAIKDSLDQSRREINNTVKWTKVTLNVSEDNTVTSAWPTAAADEGTVNITIGTGLAFYSPPEFDVLKNDEGEDLVIKLNSDYSQKGARVAVIPNYPNRPVISYSPPFSVDDVGTSFEDRVWYVIEDKYGRKNFSYLDLVVNID